MMNNIEKAKKIASNGGLKFMVYCSSRPEFLIATKINTKDKKKIKK